ncbi:MULTISPECIES: VOC family protein [unclassified Streptomyces]|uniref:VOC family protein n=1 Tax=unclassified Streptomyces TaxID=2593676 RepID=UPI002251CEC3|nr:MULTISPECIES: VOC family protein [unclassified Streptomyces]MCX4833544.1 VOC family protein [Streptomyces sp. NBC_01016]
MPATAQKIRPCLWFDGKAEEAVDFYMSLFPGSDSEILEVQRWGKEGPGVPGSVLTMEFRLAGNEYQALNGGPEFKFNEAVSLSVDCADQAEVDRLWERITADGGEGGPCGWCKDKFGLSWQIVPRRLVELLADPDEARAARVLAAMMKMGKLDVAALESA